MSTRPSFHAVTIDPDGTALDGTRVTETPDGVLSSLPALLARLAPVFEREGAGVVILSGGAAEALCVPLTAPRTPAEAKDHPVLTAPRAVGWRVSAVAPWMTFWGEQRPTLHIAVHPALDPQATGPLYDPVPFEMSWHAHRFHTLTGGAYHATPGVTGVGLLRDGYRGRKAPYWTPGERRWPAGTRQAEYDLLWERGGPAGGRYVHGYDARQMYLAAAGVAQLAIGELRHSGPRCRPSDKTAGYWRIERPTWNERRMPDPLGHRQRGVREGREALWVTTPTLLLLDELAEQGATSAPVVLDSWTAEAGRVMRGWAETLTRALAVVRESSDPADARQLAALKATYAQSLGMMARETSRVHRPDWRHAVIGTARANFWRKVWRVAQVEDRWPVSVRVDCVRYAADTRDPVAAVPSGIALGEGAGAFKIESTEEAA